jgi:hypothetical protein
MGSGGGVWQRVEGAERDSNPLRIAAGFEASGAKRRRKRHTGGLGAADGTRGEVAAQAAGGAGPAGSQGARPRVLPGAASMLLDRRRSRRRRLRLYQEGVTGVTGTGTRPQGKRNKHRT